MDEAHSSALTGSMWRCFLIACLIFGSDAVAQELPWTLDCAEVIHAEATEALDDFAVRKDRVFSITFSRISEDEWIMTGNAGSVPVVSILGPGVIHFLESTPFGTINITQVSLADDRGTHNAVHSRHPVIADTLAPSQYLLQCQVR